MPQLLAKSRTKTCWKLLCLGATVLISRRATNALLDPENQLEVPTPDSRRARRFVQSAEMQGTYENRTSDGLDLSLVVVTWPSACLSVREAGVSQLAQPVSSENFDVHQRDIYGCFVFHGRKISVDVKPDLTYSSLARS